MNTEIVQLPVSEIRPLIHRWRDPGEFKRMKESIRAEGLLQPIQVRRISEKNAARAPQPHKYELIVGEGRLEAFKALRRSEIPAIVLDVGEPEIIGRFLSENVLRKDLPWLDQAKLIKHEFEAASGTGGMTLKQIAKKFFITEGHAAKLLRILSQASPKIERELGRLTVAQAEALVSLPVTGQEIVVEVLREEYGKGDSGESPLPGGVQAVVAKAKAIAAEGKPLSKMALKQSVRRVTEELAKLRQVLKLKRLHASLGPENLRLLLSDKAFKKAMDREGINYSKFIA